MISPNWNNKHARPAGMSAQREPKEKAIPIVVDQPALHASPISSGQEHEQGKEQWHGCQSQSQTALVRLRWLSIRLVGGSHGILRSRNHHTGSKITVPCFTVGFRGRSFSFRWRGRQSFVRFVRFVVPLPCAVPHKQLRPRILRIRRHRNDHRAMRSYTSSPSAPKFTSRPKRYPVAFIPGCIAPNSFSS
jgi:hypothetical protein